MSDTPFHRKLVKVAFQVFAGRANRHRYVMWPGLDMTDEQAPKWRGRPVASRCIRSLPDGLAEITIIGSGPSVASLHLERLPEGAAIFLNGAIALAHGSAPLAIACEDERFVWRHRDLFYQAPRDCIWMLSPAVMRCLLERDGTVLDGLTILPIIDLLKPPHHPRRRLDDPEIASLLRETARAALSTDPATGTIPVGTVAFSVLQHALAAKPALIGLAGIDLSNAHLPRFNETADNTAFSGIVTALDRILAHFQIARDVAPQNGVALECYSPVSALLDISYPYSDRLS